MKFCGSILTLFALAADTNAFTAQAPMKTSTKLFSTPQGGPPQGGPSFNAPGSGGPGNIPERPPIPGGMTRARDVGRGNMPTGNADMLGAGKYDMNGQTIIQGQSLRTWPVEYSKDSVHLSMESDGRPLTANVEMWYGPDYTPAKMTVYIEDGMQRPFNALLPTPGQGNNIAVYNTGNMEFPFFCSLDGGNTPMLAEARRLQEKQEGRVLVQGGAIKSFPFDPSVESVQVFLKTDGRHLQARLELLQGPNNDKQVIEYYSSDGKKRPFYAIIESPGSGNVVRIINEATVEFPFSAFVEPYLVR